MHTSYRSVIDEYRQVNAQTGVAAADPHRLILMLLDGALEKIDIARRAMEQKQIAKKAEYISWAISIIDGLRLSLDKAAGGQIAQKLDDLYEYMGFRLVHANLKNDMSVLDEVSGLLKEIRAAWVGISDQVKVRDEQAPTSVAGAKG